MARRRRKKKTGCLGVLLSLIFLPITILVYLIKNVGKMTREGYARERRVLGKSASGFAKMSGRRRRRY